MGDTRQSAVNRKLVVLGIPWDIDTDGLKQYMSKYGAIDDIVVMKERGTGRSRGFGYVTFSSSEGTEKALATKHVLNGRLLEVKVATPKEDMKPPPKKITRIFVARIPYQVTEEAFRRYFESFGTITDVYMPKDQGAKTHRGIGFITYENSESVDKVMAETHELGGSMVAVDEATPKEEPTKNWDKGYSSAYGAYSPYVAATRFGSFGMPPFGGYDYAGPGLASNLGPGPLGRGYGAGSWSGPPVVPPSHNSGPPLGSSGAMRSLSYGSSDQSMSTGRDLGNKIFVGRLPSEATSNDLRRYFSNFGRILDVYLPKDSKRTGHRGFGFVTFADGGPAQRVARRSHELLGHQIIVEQATPQDEAGTSSRVSEAGSAVPIPTAGGPIRGIGSMYPGYRDSLDYNGWGPLSGSGVGQIMAADGGPYGGGRASRLDSRYRPY